VHIKFCEIRKMVIKTYQLMEIVFGDAALSQAIVFEWFHHFKDCLVPWMPFNKWKW
jgi:hypothetical protein